MLNPAENPDVQALTPVIDQLAALAVNYQVTTASAYSTAAEDLKRVKNTLAKIEEVRKSFTAPLDQAKKAIMDFFRGPTARLEVAEAGIKRACTSFQQQEELRRREEQRKADEVARKERDRLEAQAAKAREQGKEGRAAGLEDRAAAVSAPVISRDVPKVAGVSFRTVWKFEVTDPAQVPREYLAVDEQAIRKVVQALQGKVTIPGVRIFSEEMMAAARA